MNELSRAMPSVDVSLILTAHNERNLIARTLKSLDVASRYAAEAGIVVELVVVLDRSTPDMLMQLQRYRSDAFQRIVILAVDHGSPGSARNDGIAAARGEYIAICDADDLVCTNMIERLHARARAAAKPVVVVPEYGVYFGDTTFARKYFDLDVITPLVLLQYHPYTSRLFALRRIFLEIPYQDPFSGGIYAHEDWSLMADIVAAGYQVVVAQSTVAFYRRRPRSVSAQARLRSNDQIAPSRLFAPECFILVCDGYRPRLTGAIGPGCSEQPDRTAIAASTSSFFGSDAYRQMVLEANLIEPAIAMNAYRVSQLEFPGTDALLTGSLYLKFCDLVAGRTFSDIFLIPSLAAGGSEKYMMQIMESIAHGMPRSGILVICYDPSARNEWFWKVPDGVTVVTVSELPVPANWERILLLVHKCLQAVASGARVHLKTSPFLFEFFRRGFGAALSGSLVVYYRFCDERVLAGSHIVTTPNKFEFFSANFAAFDMVLCDHTALIALDRERFGIDPEKWVCLPAYCALHADPATVALQRQRSNRRFLWASRLVAQKFPLLLLLIADLLADRGTSITIDVFGSGSNNPDAVDPAIFEGCSQLSYRGPYADFEVIDASVYDGFVYTTMYDGLPNVVLEAMASGLPVIAPACDGLPDVVIDGVTGFLTPYGADIVAIAESYCNAMEALSADADLRVAVSRNGLDLIARKHSQQAHRCRVRDIFKLDAAGLQKTIAREMHHV